jgi:hypothetical protein
LNFNKPTFVCIFLFIRSVVLLPFGTPLSSPLTLNHHIQLCGQPTDLNLKFSDTCLRPVLVWFFYTSFICSTICPFDKLPIDLSFLSQPNHLVQYRNLDLANHVYSCLDKNMDSKYIWYLNFFGEFYLVYMWASDWNKQNSAVRTLGKIYQTNKFNHFIRYVKIWNKI